MFLLTTEFTQFLIQSYLFLTLYLLISYFQILMSFRIPSSLHYRALSISFVVLFRLYSFSHLSLSHSLSFSSIYNINDLQPQWIIGAAAHHQLDFVRRREKKSVSMCKLLIGSISIYWPKTGIFSYTADTTLVWSAYKPVQNTSISVPV